MNKKMFIILFVYYFYFVYSATESLKTIKMEEYTKDKETTSAKGAICMNMKKMKSGDNNLYILLIKILSDINMKILVLLLYLMIVQNIIKQQIYSIGLVVCMNMK